MNAHPTNASLMLCVRWPPSLNRPQLMFLIHGLWEPGCRVEGDISPGEVAKIPKELMIQLRRFMPSMIGDDLWKNHYILWQNEWKRHGEKMNIPIEKYFQRTLRLFSRIPQPEHLGIEVGSRFTVAEFTRKSKAAVSKVEVDADATPEVVGYLDRRSRKRKVDIYDCRYYFDEDESFVAASQTFSGDISSVNEEIGLPKKPFLLKDS